MTAETSGVRAEFVLKGARISLDAAGIFQTDAILCYRENRYASSIVLGQIALEHLGQFDRLYGMWFQNGPGASTVSVSCKELRRARKHPKMAKDGLLSFQMAVPQGIDVGSDEGRYAASEVLKKRHKREPDRLVKMRFRAQYVRPDEPCRDWSGPRNCKQDDAHAMLMNVGNSHKGCLSRMFFDVRCRSYSPDFRQVVKL